ncbi:MAG: hypothetical protein M3155_09525, partial [Actinomycetota bacterium]|nr:hypothetical protein [Actinomycetota bacterium]
AALAGAACGTRPFDLFALTRTGSIPGAQLRLVVRDDGLVHCNAGPRGQLPGPLLLDAREVARELDGPAMKKVALPPGPGAVLRYRIRLEHGTVSFADDSRGQTKAMFLAQRLARDVARRVCGLPR